MFVGSFSWGSVVGTDYCLVGHPFRTAWLNCGLCCISSCLPSLIHMMNSMNGSPRILRVMLKTRLALMKVSMRCHYCSVSWWQILCSSKCKQHHSHFQVVMFVWLFNFYWLCIALLQHCMHEEILAKCCNFQDLCILCAGFVTDVDVLMVTDWNVQYIDISSFFSPSSLPCSLYFFFPVYLFVFLLPELSNTIFQNFSFGLLHLTSTHFMHFC